jgi:serine/threonine protein kinase
MYPDCTPEEIDLLKELLRFNPFERITSKQALRHSYFKDIRCKARETEGPPLALTTKVPDTISIQQLKEYCETGHMASKEEKPTTMIT